jgi:hypothetical protein
VSPIFSFAARKKSRIFSKLNITIGYKEVKKVTMCDARNIVVPI